MKAPPVTVLETPEFIAALRDLMDDEEQVALVDYLAEHPTSGVLIPGTGGVRKLRWALEGRGKRGGARVIYYFHNENLPLFALTAYAKNQRADLSQKDRNNFRKLIAALIAGYRRRIR